MGFFTSILITCVFIYILLGMGIRFFAKSYPKIFLRCTDLVDASAFLIALLLGGVVLFLFSDLPFTTLLSWVLGGLVILGIPYLKVKKNYNFLAEFLLCLVCSFFLFQSVNPFIAVVLALLWWGMWHIFVFFNTFALVSFITSLSWGIALLITGFIIQNISLGMLGQIALVCISASALSRVKLSQKLPVFGKLSVAIIGFAWGGIWTYFLSNGALLQTITAFGYYLFEAIFLCLMIIKHQPLETFLTKLLKYPQFASKAVSITFSHTLILSFIAALMIGGKRLPVAASLFILTIVLIDLYMRFNAFEHPVPTWKGVFKDLKNTFSEGINQVKKGKIFEQKPVKNPEKKMVKNAPKKVPVKKTKVSKKKKVVRKK